jgi:hypothetical protein
MLALARAAGRLEPEKSAHIAVSPWQTLADAERQATDVELERYSAFLAKPVHATWVR